MSGQSGQFPNYASHIRLSDSHQTPMYLSQPPPVLSELKANDHGQVKRYDGQEKYNELEGQKPAGVYELEGSHLSPTKTKELPDLPPPDEDGP